MRKCMFVVVLVVASGSTQLVVGGVDGALKLRGQARNYVDETVCFLVLI